MVWSPCLIRLQDRAGAVSVQLGHPLLDDYLEFVAARSRTNTLLATAYALKVFFVVVAEASSRAVMLRIGISRKDEIRVLPAARRIRARRLMCPLPAAVIVTACGSMSQGQGREAAPSGREGPCFLRAVWARASDRMARRHEDAALHAHPSPHPASVLAWPVVDQAWLHGVITRVGDLGLPLLSVQRIGSGSEHP